MRLFKKDGYSIVISDEALLLKPFRELWNRDRTKNKEHAILELGYLYFMGDARSDYCYIKDMKDRSNAVIMGEGMPDKWKPDKKVEDALEFYKSFSSVAALLLEDTKFLINNFREKLKSIDFSELEIKDIKEIGAIIKQVPSMVRDLDEAERTLAKEIANSDKVRGSQEKAIYEDL